MNDPDKLRADARADREKAEEVAESNPMWSEYLERRADWRDHLARKEEEFNDAQDR